MRDLNPSCQIGIFSNQRSRTHSQVGVLAPQGLREFGQLLDFFGQLMEI